MAWLAAEKTPPPLPQGGGGNHLAGGEGGCGGPCSYIYIYTLADCHARKHLPKSGLCRWCSHASHQLRLGEHKEWASRLEILSEFICISLRSMSFYPYHTIIYYPLALGSDYVPHVRWPCCFLGGVAPSCGHSSSSRSSEVQRAPGSLTALGFPVKALLQTNHLRIHWLNYAQL